MVSFFAKMMCASVFPPLCTNGKVKLITEEEEEEREKVRRERESCSINVNLFNVNVSVCIFEKMTKNTMTRKLKYVQKQIQNNAIYKVSNIKAY